MYFEALIPKPFKISEWCFRRATDEMDSDLPPQSSGIYLLRKRCTLTIEKYTGIDNIVNRKRKIHAFFLR